jgi:PST family polysaccharide transporter
MQLVIAGTALVRNKVLAVRLGADGFGEFAQLSLLALAASTVVAFGFGMSLNRNVAATADPAERQKLLAQANAIVMLLAAIVAAVAVPILWWRPEWLAVVGLPPDPAIARAALLFVAFVPVDAAVVHRVAFLTGALDIAGMTRGRSLALAAGTAVGVPIVWWFGLPGAALQVLLLTGLIAGFLDRRLRRTGYRPWAVRFDGDAFRTLAGLGAASLAAGFAAQASDVLVRSTLIRTVDAAQNGLYQAALSITYQVKAIVLGSVGSYSVATLAQNASRDHVHATAGRLLTVVLPLAAVALGGLGLLSGPAILILYAPEFLPAQHVLPWLLAADFAQVAIWVLGAPLLATRRTARWLTYELLFAAARAAGALLLLPFLGVVGVAAGYLAATVLHLTINAITYSRLMGYAVPGRAVVLFVGGIAMVAGLASLGARVTFDLAVYGLGVTVLATYTVFAVHSVVGLREAADWVRARLGGRT